VYSLVMRDGLLFAGTHSGTIAVWNALWEPQAPLLSHTGIVSALTVAGDNLLSGSKDKTLKVWALPQRTLTRTVQHPGYVYDVVVREDQAITCCEDKKVRVFGMVTGALQHTLDAPSIVYALALHESTLLSAGYNGHLSAWCTTFWELTDLEGGGEVDDTVYTPCLAVLPSSRGILVGWGRGALQLFRPPA
jgi:WD40 repeat protein